MTAPATSSLLDTVAGLKPLIEAHADEADKQRHMSDEVIDAMKAAGLFQMWLPKSLGGGETPLPESMKIFEELARIDGSTGWVIWIAAVAGPIGAYSSEDAMHEVHKPGEVTIGAGGIFPFQPAEKVDGGYRITAQWPYNSGSHHATWLGGGAIVVQNGEPIMTPFGTPEIRFLNFPREQAEILDTWKVTGLRATGSSDVVVKNLFVPEHQTVPIGPGMTPNAECQAPIFKVPFWVHIGMPIGALALGIAQHAVDAFTELAASKAPAGTEVTLAQRPTTHRSFGSAVASLKAARSFFYEVTDTVWDLTVAGEAIPMDVRLDMQLAGAHATQTAAEVVDAIQLDAGGTAIYETSPLERCFRDIHTLTQHAGTSHRNFENAGGLLLGQPPASPLILL